MAEPLPIDMWKQRWKVTSDWKMLHRVSRIHAVLYPDDYDGPTHITGETCCGLEGRLRMPGIVSRLGLIRCPTCCEAAGVPNGHGMPGNHGVDEPTYTPLNEWGV